MIPEKLLQIGNILPKDKKWLLRLHNVFAKDMERNLIGFFHIPENLNETCRK